MTRQRKTIANRPSESDREFVTNSRGEKVRNVAYTGGDTTSRSGVTAQDVTSDFGGSRGGTPADMDNLTPSQEGYLRAVNEIWESTDVYADAIVDDIVGDGGTFDESNRLILVVNPAELGNPVEQETMEDVADNYRDFCDRRDSGEDVWGDINYSDDPAGDLSAEISGQEFFNPAYAAGVQVVTASDTGSSQYRVFDKDNDLVLSDVVSGMDDTAPDDGSDTAGRIVVPERYRDGRFWQDTFFAQQAGTHLNAVDDNVASVVSSLERLRDDMDPVVEEKIRGKINVLQDTSELVENMFDHAYREEDADARIMDLQECAQLAERAKQESERLIVEVGVLCIISGENPPWM